MASNVHLPDVCKITVGAKPALIALLTPAASHQQRAGQELTNVSSRARVCE